MKLNFFVKIGIVTMIIISMLILASCAEQKTDVIDNDVTPGTTNTADTADAADSSEDTTAPAEENDDNVTDIPADTVKDPQDTEFEETTDNSEPARDAIELITPWEDESESPDEVITVEELEALVKSADEACEWLRVYNTFLENDAEPYIYRETEYYPVADYKTVDELKDRLLECFSVSLVNKMVDSVFNSESPLFIVENGILMGCHHVRITNVELQIVSNFYAYRIGERTASFTRPIQVKKVNNGATMVARDEYNAQLVFEYGKWVFDSYPDFEIE